MLRIGITGKRMIPEHERPDVARKIEEHIRGIMAAHNANEFVGYSSIAVGADTIFAEVIKKVFKMPLKIILPFAIDEYRKDFTNDSDLQVLDKIIDGSTDVETVGTTIPADTRERANAYWEAGKYLVDHTEEMIFVWDSCKPAGRGGTAEVMGYYQEKNADKPVDYIAVGAAGKDPLNTQISKSFDQYNTEAIRTRDNYKLIWKSAILLGWLAVVFFAAGTAFGDQLTDNGYETLKFAGVCVEFLLVLTVFIIIVRAKSKNYHGRYLSARLKAEILRILRCFHHANMEIKIAELHAEQDEELAGIAGKVNTGVQASSYSSSWYGHYTIKALMGEQKKYHTEKMRVIGVKYHFFEQLNMAVAVLFIVNLAAHLIGAGMEVQGKHLPGYLHEIVFMLSILLPATYAALEGILYFQEWDTLKKYSASVIKSLDDIDKYLQANRGDTDEKAIQAHSVALNLLASTLLTDNRNWHSILEHKNNYHWVI